MPKSCFDGFLTPDCEKCPDWSDGSDPERGLGCATRYPIMECPSFAKMYNENEGEKKVDTKMEFRVMCKPHFYLIPRAKGDPISFDFVLEVQGSDIARWWMPWECSTALSSMTGFKSLLNKISAAVEEYEVDIQEYKENYSTTYVTTMREAKIYLESLIDNHSRRLDERKEVDGRRGALSETRDGSSEGKSEVGGEEQ